MTSLTKFFSEPKSNFLDCDEKLKPLLERRNHSRDPRFIVSVSAKEGVLSYTSKTTSHLRTNMAKAALHMITRIAGDHCAESGIYMTSVDTGRVADEKPAP